MLCLFSYIAFLIVIIILSICLFIFIKKSNKWKFVSRHDKLTGLLNREEFEHLLVQRMEFVKKNPEYMLIYCMIDLDDFKKINDFKGHKEGDRILISVAKHLKKSIRTLKENDNLLDARKKLPKLCYKDILCRYGGEEFAAAIIAKRKTLDNIIECRLEKVCIEGGCGASVGSAMFLPQMEIHVRNLTDNADFVMYTNKRRKKKKSKLPNEELLKLCPGYEEYSEQDDRRQYKRIKVKGLIGTFKFNCLSCFREETTFTAKILDISQGGLSFLSQIANVELMKVGTKLQMEFTLKGERHIYDLEIRHFNPNTNVCGCKFI